MEWTISLACRRVYRSPQHRVDIKGSVRKVLFDSEALGVGDRTPGGERQRIPRDRGSATAYPRPVTSDYRVVTAAEGSSDLQHSIDTS
jgi:hypothetical protein